MKRTIAIGIATAALAVGPAALAQAGEQHHGGQPSQSCGCEPRHHGHGHGHDGHGKPGHHHGNGEHPKPTPKPKPPHKPHHPKPPVCSPKPPHKPPHHGHHHHHPRPPKPPVVHPRPPVITPPAPKPHHATPVVHHHTSHVAGHVGAPPKELAFTASTFDLLPYVEGGLALLCLGGVFRLAGGFRRYTKAAKK